MAFDAQRQGHHWRFDRLGGFDQVAIESAEDLRRLPELEPKLWAALSCPTRGLEFDAHTLDLLDSDGDGRIRVPEVLAAVTWTCRLLQDPADLLRPAAGLPLAAIDASHPEGQRLLATARRILASLGKPEATVITAEETADTKRIFAGTRFNGDGVVPASAAEDDDLAKAIEDVIACVGSVPDRGGVDGIDQPLCERFFAEAAEYLAWWAEAEADPERLLPLGERTEQAMAIFAAIQPKIDDYFTRARLADYDARAADLLNPADADYAALTRRTLSAATEELADFPLARVEPGRPLPLDHAVNPRWAESLAAFRAELVVPLLGALDSLTESQWLDIRARFAAHAAWSATRRGAAVAQLGVARVRELVDGGARAAIEALIARDRELDGEAEAIESVDRLLHYHQHLARLLHNFVSLRDFYTPGKQAVFQAGTLYLDGRSCDLCVQVADLAAHSALAALSQTYLAYCDCRRRGDAEERMTIAAAFTAGDADNLMVGRNGIFFDRKGRDWDATITRIVDHPISVGQAFWSPYKRIGRMISAQIQKFAGERDKAVDDNAAKGLLDLSAKVQSGKPETAPAPFDIGKFAGIFAAIGLAVGAIGTAVASVLSGLLGLSWWQIPLAILGLMLLVSGPSMVIAFVKLRQRNLGPLLDANGWAVNTLARISIPFGSTLTRTAQLPKGAARSLRDPFADKKRPWKTYLVLLVLLAATAELWREGYLATWWTQLQPLLQGQSQPAAPAPAPASEVAAPTASPEPPGKAQ